MSKELTYILNIFLIILYSVAMTHSFFLFYLTKKKNNLFIIMGIYFLILIFDNLIISMTEVINPFGRNFNLLFMGISVFKTVTYMIVNYCQLMTVFLLKKEKVNTKHFLLLGALFAWMVIISMFPNSPLRVFLYYLPNQIFLFYIGILALSDHKSIIDLADKYLIVFGYMAIIFSSLILLEDSFVIFNIDTYDINQLNIQNRNFSENLFTISVSFLSIYYFLFDAKESVLEAKYNGLSHSRHNKTIDEQKIIFFSKKYGLTDRETEILSFMLKHYNNQEIADKLFLSIGTIKTHTHNIYQKVNVKTRQDLINKYQNYV